MEICNDFASGRVGGSGRRGRRSTMVPPTTVGGAHQWARQGGTGGFSKVNTRSIVCSV